MLNLQPERVGIVHVYSRHVEIKHTNSYNSVQYEIYNLIMFANTFKINHDKFKNTHAFIET